MNLHSFETALFDVDGTLIDSNGAHAETWAQAFNENGVAVASFAIRPLVGMGGDKLIPAVAHVDEHSALGQAVAKRKKTLFAERLSTLHPTRGARELVGFLRDRGIDLVVATSADRDEMAALLERAGVSDLMPLRASKDHAGDSKPDPEIVHAAMTRAGARRATSVLVGDTPYDVESARRAGIAAIALRCGGYWSDAELRQAAHIFDDPIDLLQALRRSIHPLEPGQAGSKRGLAG